MSNKKLVVTSHVGRDVLSSASLFKDDAAVIWEYISNSLQYIDQGVSPKVIVSLDKRKKVIEIADNGRGMDRQDLARFFTMHEENLDRALGRPGRGRFGTGKSACFAIANSLLVDTVKDKKRNVVRLKRDDLEGSKKSVPVEEILKDQDCPDENGTKVSLESLFSKVNVSRVVDYVERHLQAFRSLQPEVLIDEFSCEYKEPEISEEFEFQPSQEQLAVLGSVTLHVKVSQAPLKQDQRGVAISSGTGNLIAIETGGVDSKEMGEFLFGEIDIPAIETFQSDIEIIDSSRSMQLKMGHPLANALIPFVASNLEIVRKKLVARKKEEKKSEQEQQLKSEADKLSDLLNQDLSNLVDRLQTMGLASTQRRSVKIDSQTTTGNGESFAEGTSERGTLFQIDRKDKSNEKDENKKPNLDPDIPKAGEFDSSGNSAVDPAKQSAKSSKRKPKGGFRIEFDHHGSEKPRSKYLQDKGIIYINLDHPVVSAAQQFGTDDPSFRRLAYEIAFTEYAFAVAANVIAHDPDIPADEIHYEISSTLYRISNMAADLYK